MDAYRETRWNHGGDHFTRGIPRLMTSRISPGPVNWSSSMTDLPTSKAACASDPTVPAILWISANSLARRLNEGDIQRELNTSIASTSGRISNKSASSQPPCRNTSNGCDTLINAPCSFKRWIVSCGESPRGISSRTNAARISPRVVMISSPTITNSGSMAWASSAPPIELWSVMMTRSIPLRRAAFTKSAGRVRESLEKQVWQWNSMESMVNYSSTLFNTAIAIPQIRQPSPTLLKL